jgi:hypothetical protein
MYLLRLHSPGVLALVLASLLIGCSAEPTKGTVEPDFSPQADQEQSIHDEPDGSRPLTKAK